MYEFSYSTRFCDPFVPSLALCDLYYDIYFRFMATFVKNSFHIVVIANEISNLEDTFGRHKSTVLIEKSVNVVLFSSCAIICFARRNRCLLIPDRSGVVFSIIVSLYKLRHYYAIF